MRLEARGKHVSGLNATVPTVNKLITEYLVYTNHLRQAFCLLCAWQVVQYCYMYFCVIILLFK